MAISSAAHLFLMSRPVRGSFINSSPFLSQDGFDWVFEGAALFLGWRDVGVDPWPVLRDPVFVLVTATDAAFDANGWVIRIVLCASIAAAHLSMIRIAELLSVPRRVTACFVLASLWMPLSQYRLMVLADGLAVALMMLSMEAMLRAARERGSAPWLLAAGLLATLAGSTQIYGLLPVLATAGIFGLAGLTRRRRPRWDLAAVALLSVATVFALRALWIATIPHVDRPSQFGLLEVGMGMADFYANVWTVCFASLLPFAFAVLRHVDGRALLAQPAAASIWATALTFAGFTFFYQWPESRFTCLYQPLVYLGVMTLAPNVLASSGSESSAMRRRIERAAFATLAVVLLQSTTIASKND